MVMEEKEKESERIRHLIDQRLKARVAAAILPHPSDAHLDEDSICAFVEGRLEDAEAVPVTSHLVVCTACRQTTAQLIRFESQFDSQAESTQDESPGRMRSLLDRLASHVTPAFEEDVVFAYQSPADDLDAEPGNEETPEKSEDRN